MASESLAELARFAPDVYGFRWENHVALFIVTALVLVLVGPNVASAIAGWVGLSPAFSLVWAIARWPLMVCLVVLGVDLVYYFAPNRRGRWATCDVLGAASEFPSECRRDSR